MRKSAGALCVLVAGLVLQFAGFEPNVEQSAETKQVIQNTFALVPAICFVIGGLLFTRFGFNEAEYQATRKAISAAAQSTRD